jgi:3-oxoacyl-[acyl-carrier protein] reductase
LKDKVALVTGGSRGIGRAIAIGLAREGATVAVNFRENIRAAEETVKAIEGRGGVAFPMQADVSRAEEVNVMVERIIERLGGIHILVNNAGIARDALLLTMEETDWHGVMNTNFLGVVHCTKAVVKTMMLQKDGKIINVSSIVAERAGKGHSNYASSKGAINAFTRAMAIELGSKGILVNAVAPGLILTDMTRPIEERSKPYVKEHVALGRLGKAEEIASLVVFLASDESSYITGQVIRIDGGLI